MHFKTFRFYRHDGKIFIKCKKCDAPEVDFYNQGEKKIYGGRGWMSSINDCRSDIDLNCNTCANTEIAEGVDMLFLGDRVNPKKSTER